MIEEEGESRGGNGATMTTATNEDIPAEMQEDWAGDTLIGRGGDVSTTKVNKLLIRR